MLTVFVYNVWMYLDYNELSKKIKKKLLDEICKKGITNIQQK